jgi:gamma-glutamyltranspeptidase/glutathione hydrolase
MRLAYWDRASYMGDPDFVDVPVKMLRSKAHIKELKSYIKPTRATPSKELRRDRHLYASNSFSTTHFSIIDQEGNMVSATLTINYLFGSGFVAGNTGVLLNDEMDDFSTKVGQKNVFGLVGHQANSIEPKKRPLSSMSPTFLIGKERVGILGTPGGSRIPTMVTLATIAFLDGKGPISWVGEPRYHHQYLPDVVEFENDAFDKVQRQQLEKMGYQLERVLNTYSGRSLTYGDMQAVFWDKEDNFLQAVSDFRGGGLALVKQ